jgi:CBS domain-containing protein
MNEKTLQESAMRIERLGPLISERLMLIDMDATMRDAALGLSNPGIGLIVVHDSGGKAIGVISKSDLIRHLIDPSHASIASLMSQDIVACGPDDAIRAVWQTMVERRLQNMPVLSSDGKPIGVLDIRDAMNALFEQEEFEEQMLANYVAGVGYR